MNISSKKIFTLIILLTFSLNSILAQQIDKDDNESSQFKKPKYNLTISVDKDISSFSSADYALSAIELYRMVDEKNISNSENLAVRIFGYIPRLILNLYITTAQHEIGGHGYRLRENGVGVISYEFNLDGGASTRYSASKYNNLHIHEQIAVDIGGMQANYILSQKITDRYFEDNLINPSFGIAYFWSNCDQPSYLSITESDEKNNGNDIKSYGEGINILYGEKYLTIDQLKKNIIIDVLDPFIYFSLYSFIMNENFSIPMIKIGMVDYLPAFRTILAPYGPEYRFINHIRFQDKYFRVHLGYGKNKNFTSIQLGLKTNNFIKYNNFSLGFEIDIWSQPELMTNKPLQAKDKMGGLAELNSKFNLQKNISFLLSAGFKTNGFMEGRPLKGAAMIRAGIEFSL